MVGGKKGIGDYWVWVGVDVCKEVVEKIECVMFCMKGWDMGLVGFMNMGLLYEWRGKGLNGKRGVDVEDGYSNAE